MGRRRPAVPPTGEFRVSKLGFNHVPSMTTVFCSSCPPDRHMHGTNEDLFTTRCDAVCRPAGGKAGTSLAGTESVRIKGPFPRVFWVKVPAQDAYDVRAANIRRQAGAGQLNSKSQLNSHSRTVRSQPVVMSKLLSPSS